MYGNFDKLQVFFMTHTHTYIKKNANICNFNTDLPCRHIDNQILYIPPIRKIDSTSNHAFDDEVFFHHSSVHVHLKFFSGAQESFWTLSLENRNVAGIPRAEIVAKIDILS